MGAGEPCGESGGLGKDTGLYGDMSGDGDMGRVSWAGAGLTNEDGDMGQGGAKDGDICWEMVGVLPSCPWPRQVN